MLTKIFCKRHLILGGLIPVIPIDDKKLDDYQKIRGVYLQSGWERVKLIFKEDSMGCFHPDLQRSLEMAEAGMFLGALWGAVIGSKESVDKFLNNNDATVFVGNKDAMSQMGKKSLAGGAYKALQVGSVFAAFAGGFILFTSCVQAYRLKEGILEYCIGGFMIGSLFRFHYGLKGMIVGGVVASLLGGIYGVAEISASKLLGKNPTELKFLIASYKKEVADSTSSTYYTSGQTPSFTVSQPVPKPSQSCDENTKLENKT